MRPMQLCSPNDTSYSALLLGDTKVRLLSTEMKRGTHSATGRAERRAEVQRDLGPPEVLSCFVSACYVSSTDLGTPENRSRK